MTNDTKAGNNELPVIPTPQEFVGMFIAGEFAKMAEVRERAVYYKARSDRQEQEIERLYATIDKLRDFIGGSYE